MEAYSGSMPDIIPLLRFYSCQLVYFHLTDTQFSSNTQEGSSHFVEIPENVGYLMIYKVLTGNTKKIIHWSSICAVNEPSTLNLQLDPIDREVDKPNPSKLSRKTISLGENLNNVNRDRKKGCR